jgi:hypothetical protein
MCFPIIHSNLPLNDQKAVVFEHITTNLLDPKYLEYYVTHIINDTNGDRSTQINHEELVKSFYSNLLVIRYSDLHDLIVKVQSLSYILSTDSIKLVMLDSANLTIEQNIVCTDGNYIDEIRPRRTTFDMDFKARKSINDIETRIYMNVYNVLNNLQNKFNFSIMNLYYDYERYPLYTSLMYKMNRNPFFNLSLENDPGIYHFKYDYEDEKIEFIVRLTHESVKDRYNLIAPLSKNEQFFSDFKPFGITSLEGDNKITFKAFIYSYTHQDFIQIAEEVVDGLPSNRNS